MSIIGLLVSAVLTLTGCSGTHGLSAVSHQEMKKTAESSTIRSQDSPLDREWSHSNGATSVNNSNAVPRIGYSQLPSPNVSNLQSAEPGHSFSPSRARLGRPVPVQPNGLVTQDPANTNQMNGSSAAASGNSMSAQNVVPQATGQSSFPVASPWQMGGHSAWRPAPAEAWSESGDRNLETNPQRSGLSASPVTSPESQTSPVPGFGLSKQLDARPSANTDEQSSMVDAVTELPESGPFPEQQSPVLPEPTMLDRLRGLYNPRIDENTDKLKKQIRRWPDPFGLLKERETAEAPVANMPEDNSTAIDARPDEMAGASTGIPVPAIVTPSSIQTAIAELERELSEWPRKPSGKPDLIDQWRQKQTDLRLMYMIAGQSAESVRIIESLPEEEQEFWQSLMLSMNRYRDPREETSKTDQITESLDHLRAAVKKLQPLSSLSIRRTMLCSRIDGFGAVATFPTANFEPGQRILIYAELQNFQSELTAEGKFRSEFAAVLDFMREGDEEIVETIRVPQIEDFCDVERTDYFQSFELTLPALEGKYLMRLQLRDQLSLQVAESTLEFSVRSRN